MFKLKIISVYSITQLSCVLCNQPSYQTYSICAACEQLILRTIQTNSTTVNNTLIRYLTPYQSPTKELLNEGKFNKNIAALKSLGILFAKHIALQGYNHNVTLIPVPLHQKSTKRSWF